MMKALVHAILTTLSLYTALLDTATAQERPEIKIGVILPMTGAVASVGEAMQRGMTMALSDTKHITAKIIVEDDQTANRVSAVNAAKKLATVDKVDIVFNAYASTVSALSPVLKSSDVPCLVVWDSNRALQQLGKHILGFGYENELAGEDMASFAYERLGHKTVGIIGFHDEWSEVVSQAFGARVKALGGKIVLEEQVRGDTTDFRTIMARAKALHAGAIYLPLFGGVLQSAIKQARTIQFEGDLLSPDGFVEADIDATGSAVEELYVTQIWFENAEFRKKYEATYGNSRISGTNLGYTALAYDAVLLVDAVAGHLIHDGEKVTRPALLRKLPGFAFEGVLGSIQISQNNSVERRERILQVKDGAFVEVGR